MKRVALLVQYDGSKYSGWQRQKNATTVQEIIESALLKITQNEVKTFAAGRTDAGVHASGQVVHFDIDCVIPSENFSDVLNSFLPQSIRVLESVEVKSNWHACYSAIYRHYRYVINNSKIPNLFSRFARSDIQKFSPRFARCKISKFSLLVYFSFHCLLYL